MKKAIGVLAPILIVVALLVGVTALVSSANAATPSYGQTTSVPTMTDETSTHPTTETPPPTTDITTTTSTTTQTTETTTTETTTQTPTLAPPVVSTRTSVVTEQLPPIPTAVAGGL